MSTLGRLLNGGALGEVREEQHASSIEYFISFPADLVLDSVDVFSDTRRQRRISASPLDKTKTSDIWPSREERAELQFSVRYWKDTLWADSLRTRAEGLETGLKVAAVKQGGMRERWLRTGTVPASKVLTWLVHAEFPKFTAHHGASYTVVHATLREPQKALQELLVWLDMLQEKGVIMFPSKELQKPRRRKKS